jgi:hypothetical protein
MSIQKEYISKVEAVSEDTEIPSVKKGGKTKYKKVPVKKKCSCGCDLVLTKSTGGKLMETCACKCKGGKIKK